MKRILPTLTLALLLAVALTGTAFAQAHDHDKKHDQDAHHQMEGHGHMQGEMDEAKMVHAEVVDGVQVAEIEVGPMGYSASRVALKAGVPARLVFTRTKEGGCTHKVQVPDFGIEPVDLPIGEAVAVEFTPEEAGEYRFACGMDMMKGMLVVKG